MTCAGLSEPSSGSCTRRPRKAAHIPPSGRCPVQRAQNAAEGGLSCAGQWRSDLPSDWKKTEGVGEHHQSRKTWSLTFKIERMNCSKQKTGNTYFSFF